MKKLEPDARASTRIYPMAIGMGFLGLAVGTSISVMFFVRLAQAQHWVEPVVNPIEEPLFRPLIFWLTAPWGLGFMIAWHLGGGGIMPFFTGAVAMGICYAVVGFCIDVCATAVTAIRRSFRRPETVGSTK